MLCFSRDCESVTIDDERYGKKITYLMNGKIVENPFFVKEAKNTTHIRNFFAGDFLVTETYNEKEEKFVKVRHPYHAPQNRAG